MKSYAYRERGRRTDGPCMKCGSKDNRAYYENGDEHCFGCGDHKNADKAKINRGRKKLPIRGIPQESRQALNDFPNLPPASAGHSYLKSHRHKGDLSLRIVSDVRQDRKALVVPMYDRKGRLKNLLYIFPDGTKRTLLGVSTKSLFHPIGTGNTNRIWIVEGWATGVSVHRATGDDVLVSFGCNNLRAVAEHAKSPGKHVCICSDTGDKAVSIAEEAAAAVSGDLFVPRLPAGDKGTDANDLAQKLGGKELHKQIEKNTQPIPPPPDLIEVAAGLPRQEYRKCRSEIAKSLGISVRDLDSEVQSKKQELMFAEIVPWPEPVDGTELVQAIRSTLHHYVSFPDYAATAVSLWLIMTYLVDEIYTATILGITSPTKQCGKTVLLSVMNRLAYRALSTSNISSAVVFRIMEMYAPTLLIDEADTYLVQNDELRGILNSGHSRDVGYVMRCVGEDFLPTQFPTFGPKAIALIGKLPETIEDRSIVIPMRRKLEDDKKRRLRRSMPNDAFGKLQRKITRWTNDNGDALDKVRIKRPKGLQDRAYDNWLPLFQIAKRLDGDWLEDAIDASLTLAAQGASQEDSSAVLLLQDLQALFDRDGDKFLTTASIVDAFAKMDERPWPEFRRGDPITAQQMASVLKRFEIKPRLVRRGKGKPVRGYRYKDCFDAFARYAR